MVARSCAVRAHRNFVNVFGGDMSRWGMQVLLVRSGFSFGLYPCNPQPLPKARSGRGQLGRRFRDCPRPDRQTCLAAMAHVATTEVVRPHGCEKSDRPQARVRRDRQQSGAAQILTYQIQPGCLPQTSWMQARKVALTTPTHPRCMAFPANNLLVVASGCKISMPLSAANTGYTGKPKLTNLSKLN